MTTLSTVLAAAGLAAAVLCAARWAAARRAPGPAWGRQLLLGAVVLVSVASFAGWAVPR